MMEPDLEFKLIKPDQSLASFVESFWLLQNKSQGDKQIVVLPDGRADLIFFQSGTMPYQIVRSGLETRPQEVPLQAGTRMFAVSFKLLAIEYIFKDSIAKLLDYAEHLPSGFWDIDGTDLDNFELCCQKVSLRIQSLFPTQIDPRKQTLFDLLYAVEGKISVKELSEKAYWSTRQINRYFNDRFGISLKTYCNILRFRASFQHIKEGKLFPQEHFADQSHFIKEIKRLSGVSPKELKRNQNGRFVQFSALPR